jgi:subtilisin family serine protease
MNARVLPWLCLCWLAGCAAIEPAPSVESISPEHFDRYVVVTLRNPQAPVVPRAGSTVRNYEPVSSYSIAPATRASARAVAATHGLREVAAWPIALLEVHCLVYELPAGVNRDDTLERLRRDRRVESAQPLQAFNTLTDDSAEPYRRLQHNLDTMDVEGAHAASRGEGIRIAIVDTGVDETHPDLAGRIYRQENLVDAGTRVSTHDRHGTAVAGIIAADDHNQVGIAGIAPDAKLHALRACWPAPKDGARALCSTLTLAKAIAAAIEERTDIVNLSLTGPADPLLTRLVQTGLRRGIYFVGAVSPGTHADNFPEDVAGVIGVDASGDQGGSGAILYAPGRDILTLVPGGTYDFLSGSSLAAASVSGGLALLLARDRTLRAEQARSILEKSTRWIDTGQGPVASVDLCAALAMVVPDHQCANRVSDNSAKGGHASRMP